VGDGERTHRPSTAAPVEGVAAGEAPAYVPRDSAASAWTAVARIARAVPYRGTIYRKAEAGAEPGAQVSKPGDAAETEADAVADQVAGQLHGGGDDKKKGEGGKPNLV
jgi:hypothetical protein